jgi:hypothetical protein
VAIISGGMRRELREALIDAFPSTGRFKMLVGDVLDVYLSDIASTAAPLEEVVFDTIEWAERNGRLSQLVLGAVAQNPGNPRLRRMAKQFELPEALPGETESFTRSGMPFASPEAWLKQMVQVRRAVCRVEAPTPDVASYGTGFLVAPDVVMTLDALVADLWDDEGRARRATLRFGYEEDTGGGVANEGTAYHLHPTDWRVFRSGDPGLPFALLRLADWAKDGGPRWTLTPVAHRFGIGDPVQILYYAGPGPLKLAFGSVVDPDGRGVPGRLTYALTTEPGSAGAPCFSADLKLAAMHVGSTAESSYGILLGAVLEHLPSHGLS